MYEIMVVVTICIFVIPVIIHILPRAIKCFNAYASASPFIPFDESIIIEKGVNAGNHPAGIVIDSAILVMCSVLMGMAWPVTIPAGILGLIAWRKRQSALVVNKLKGVELD